MFDLTVMVVAPDAAKRAAKRRATTKKTPARRGRGAPGRPKSAGHRKAISAGLKRYWGSKRAAHRRKGKRTARSGTTRKRDGGAKATTKRAASGHTKSREAEIKKAANKRSKTRQPRAPKGTVNAPTTSKPPKPQNHTATGAQVAAATKKPRKNAFAKPRTSSLEKRLNARKPARLRSK